MGGADARVAVDINGELTSGGEVESYSGERSVEFNVAWERLGYEGRTRL
jgi:hypothetical protein